MQCVRQARGRRLADMLHAARRNPRCGGTDKRSILHSKAFLRGHLCLAPQSRARNSSRVTQQAPRPSSWLIMTKTRFTAADVRAMVRDLRSSVLGLRVANVYDLDAKVCDFDFDFGGTVDFLCVDSKNQEREQGCFALRTGNTVAINQRAN